MNDPIKTIIPGSFADLMSQSPPPSIVKHEKHMQKTKTPTKTILKNSVKEVQSGQTPQQYTEDFSLPHKEIDKVKHDVMTSSLREVNYRVWKDTIEDT